MRLGMYGRQISLSTGEMDLERLSRGGRVFSLLSIPLLLLIIRWLYREIGKKRFVSKWRCEKPPVRPAKWPLGADFIVEGLQAIDGQRFLEHNHDHFEQFGDTFENKFLGIDTVVTRDPRNIRAILATQFKDFDHGQQRYRTFSTLLGDGIFTLDGSGWSHGRSELRPHFNSRSYSSLQFLEPHVTTLLDKVVEGSHQPIDLQPLFFSLTLDTSTQFLFGKSVCSLETKEDVGFGKAFNFALKKLFQRVQVGPFYSLIDPIKFQKSCNEVRSYVLDAVHQAAESVQKDVEQGLGPQSHSSLLEDMLIEKHLSKEEIGDQLINLLVAGRDTTASLLSNLCFELARNPRIFAELQEEVSRVCGQDTPSMERFSEMRYMKCVINEALRLYPPVPINMRFANCLTTIPCGGGDDGSSPIVIDAGQAVGYSTYSLHRDRKIWGSDAEEFNPSRWDGTKHPWEFIPFNGGPRICLGQQFALCEVTYVIARLLQSIVSIRPAENETWHEELTLTLSSHTGCQVCILPKEKPRRKQMVGMMPRMNTGNGRFLWRAA